MVSVGETDLSATMMLAADAVRKKAPAFAGAFFRAADLSEICYVILSDFWIHRMNLYRRREEYERVYRRDG